jgi:5'-methylthioadenosine/S-adenosylhomocysteine nucleosidase
VILILGALKPEISKIRGAVNTQGNITLSNGSEVTIGRLDSRPVAVADIGCGKVASTYTTQYLVDHFHPTHIIFTGVGGSLNSTYEIGDMVVGVDLVQYDMEAEGIQCKRGQIPWTDIIDISASAELVKYALHFPHSGYSCYLGRIVTGDTFVHKPEHKQRIHDSGLGGDVVDMEGFSVAYVAKMNRIPFVVIRTVSDKADEEAHLNFNKFYESVANHSYDCVLHIVREVLPDGCTDQ